MKTARILIVDADAGVIQQYRSMLAALVDAEVTAVPSAQAAIEQLRGETFDLVVTDLDHEPARNTELLLQVRELDSELPIIVLSSVPATAVGRSAPRAARNVALQEVHLSKPLEPGVLLQTATRLLSGRRIKAEYDLLRRQVERPYGFDDIIGGCSAMRKVFETIEQVAGSDVDVLVVGETGTGKELVARSIHRRSGRAAGPFVPVDCGAIPESLLESEFFGHERGAFTGADSRRIGLVEFADGGTFFLDELGELPHVLQAKLLRTLQERKIRRVGGREEIDVDVRIVAATGRNLEEMIRQNRFRQDLFYRINVVRIDLPPLRERGDDIGLLAEYMAQRYGREMGRPTASITPEAYQVLAQYRWPGNVRELQNVIRRGLALAKGPMIGLEDLPDELVAAAGEGRSSGDLGYFELRDQHVAHFEQQYLSDLLARHEGDVRTASLEAKLPRGTLYRLMKKHSLDSDDFR
jgi:two-component system response regulator HydG